MLLRAQVFHKGSATLSLRWWDVGGADANPHRAPTEDSGPSELARHRVGALLFSLRGPPNSSAALGLHRALYKGLRLP